MGNTRPEWRIRQLAGWTERVGTNYTPVRQSARKGIVRGLVRPSFRRQLLVTVQALRQDRSGITRAQSHFAVRPAPEAIRTRRDDQIAQPVHRLQEGVIDSHRSQTDSPVLQVRAKPLQAGYVSEVPSIQ